MAAAKPETPPPAAAQKGEPPAAAAAAPEAAPAKKGIAALIPLVAVLILAPALSFGVGQFVLLPQLKKELTVAAVPGAEGAEAGHAAEAEEAAPAEEAGHGKEGGHGKKEGASGPTNTYEFTSIVVNLAGTMGTRYLKTTFIVTGSDKGIRAMFENNKPKLLDVTLNVLSSLSLSDLEEAGAKNLIREKLIASYNQALGKKVAEQVYFSEFVVQ